MNRCVVYFAFVLFVQPPFMSAITDLNAKGPKAREVHITLF
jgi:hypothetical protein